MDNGTILNASANLTGNGTLMLPKPEAEAGQEIVSGIYTTLMGWVHLLVKTVGNAILGFFHSGTTLTDAQIDLLLSVSALLLFVFKWRAIYGALKTYAYALLIVLCLFVVASAMGFLG